MKSSISDIAKPSKEEQRLAMASYKTLAAMLERLRSDNTEIEIEETAEKIRLPRKVLKLLAVILRAMSEGKPVSIIAGAAEMTTQAAADMLGCSRPHLVKLLEEGQIPFTRVGRHRRVKLEDVLTYKKQMKEKQKTHLIEMMKGDEELGLYDT